jgi:hypothetical protein
MRRRCEDLGRIAERLHTLLDNELLDSAMEYNPILFDPYHALRKYTKDDESIHKLMYALHEIKQDIFDLYKIARWGDQEQNGT